MTLGGVGSAWRDRRNRRRVITGSVVAVAVASAWLAGPSPATALNPLKAACGAAGLVSGVVGKACNLAQKAGKLVQGGKKLLSGKPGAALSTVLGDSASTASTALGLAAIVAWVNGGAKFALSETAKVLSETTEPQLKSTWFSSVYWRMAGLAALLTLPFLFAAAVQALIHSDLVLLLRAVFGYLPLGMLAIGIAAPVTMLMLAASDELSGLVSSAAGHAGEKFLGGAGIVAGTLSLSQRSPFLVFLLGLFVAAGAIVLWLELAIREAAVYVVVMMLPLAFAALVWPARRIWARRAVELLIALILSKFAIVAVLTLGGAALDQTGQSVTAVVAGAALIAMGTLTPWALLRLLPLTEVASSAIQSLRPGITTSLDGAWHAVDPTARVAGDWAKSVTAGMRHETSKPAPLDGPEDASDEDRSPDARARETRGAEPTGGAETKSTADTAPASAEAGYGTTSGGDPRERSSSGSAADLHGATPTADSAQSSREGPPAMTDPASIVTDGSMLMTDAAEPPPAADPPDAAEPLLPAGPPAAAEPADAAEPVAPWTEEGSVLEIRPEDAEWVHDGRAEDPGRPAPEPTAEDGRA